MSRQHLPARAAAGERCSAGWTPPRRAEFPQSAKIAALLTVPFPGAGVKITPPFRLDRRPSTPTPREALMAGRTATSSIPTLVERLKGKYPDARYELNYETPFQLLVATILAAQATDERINRV